MTAHTYLQKSSSHLSPGKRCGATAQSALGWYRGTDPVLFQYYLPPAARGASVAFHHAPGFATGGGGGRMYYAPNPGHTLTSRHGRPRPSASAALSSAWRAPRASDARATL
eukprot:scaffold12296_cov48-Phaeocystis_antarctica.AAC.1